MDVKKSCETPNSEQLKELLNLQGSQLYASSLEKFNKSFYEDVTAMINSSVPTLIDGDSLLLYCVLRESHPIISGNQFLHITYLFERFLDLLIQKGATCILVFFNFWELVWEKNFAMRTLRYVIGNHFKNNTNIPTYTFLWYYSPQFLEFKSREKPRCIITSLGFDANVKSFNEKLQNESIFANEECAQKLFSASLVYCIANDLPIIDTHSIDIGVTLIYAFNVPPKRLSNEICTKFKGECLNELDLLKQMYSKIIGVSIDLKSPRELIIEAGALYLKRFNDQNKLRLLFLYYAVQFALPLENRTPPKKLETNKEIIKQLQEFINNWQESLYSVLSNRTLNQDNFDYELISDLWQGTLFMCVLRLTTDYIENKTQLGMLHTEYENLLADVNLRLLELDQINPYPIEPIFNTKYLAADNEETSGKISILVLTNQLCVM
nr:uncharacterized protein LOC111415131 [Onthophagus taurus]